MEDTREDLRENRTAGDTKGSAERAVESDTSLQSVDGDSLASRRMAPTAEKVEDNLSQRRMEKSEVCGPLGLELEEEEEGVGRPGCRSKCWAHEHQRDELCTIAKVDVMDAVTFREDRRDGFVQSSKRKTVWRRQMGRSMWLTEIGLEGEDVIADDVVQEIVEITVDSGAYGRSDSGAL